MKSTSTDIAGNLALARLSLAAVSARGRGGCDQPAAHTMLEVCRLCFPDELSMRRAFRVACQTLAYCRPRKSNGTLAAWQAEEATLHGLVTDLLGASLSSDPHNEKGWARFRALTHRAKWLRDAARIARQDEPAMLEGLLLPPAAFDGEKLFAQVGIVVSAVGERCSVLRIFWDGSNCLVAQSLAGQFDALDVAVDPE